MMRSSREPRRILRGVLGEAGEETVALAGNLLLIHYT